MLTASSRPLRSKMVPRFASIVTTLSCCCSARARSSAWRNTCRWTSLATTAAKPSVMTMNMTRIRPFFSIRPPVRLFDELAARLVPRSRGPPLHHHYMVLRGTHHAEPPDGDVLDPGGGAEARSLDLEPPVRPFQLLLLLLEVLDLVAQLIDPDLFPHVEEHDHERHAGDQRLEQSAPPLPIKGDEPDIADPGA